MKHRQEDLQEVFERRVLRTIFGAMQKNGVWRRKKNTSMLHCTAHQDRGDEGKC